MKNRRVLLLICFAFLVFSAAAQPGGFVPVREDSLLLVRMAEGYESQYKEELKLLPPDNRKDYEALYADRWKSIRERFTGKEIYTAPDAQAYLDALVGKIAAANPELQGRPLHCYFSRSSVPNAAYIGEG